MLTQPVPKLIFFPSVCARMQKYPEIGLLGRVRMNLQAQKLLVNILRNGGAASDANASGWKKLSLGHEPEDLGVKLFKTKVTWGPPDPRELEALGCCSAGAPFLSGGGWRGPVLLVASVG